MSLIFEFLSNEKKRSRIIAQYKIIIINIIIVAVAIIVAVVVVVVIVVVAVFGFCLFEVAVEACL